jgi:hypothetical protein
MVDDVSHSAARFGRHTVSGRTRLSMRVHMRARTECLVWDGSMLQPWVREPPANGRAWQEILK